MDQAVGKRTKNVDNHTGYQEPEVYIIGGLVLLLALAGAVMLIGDALIYRKKD